MGIKDFVQDVKKIVILQNFTIEEVKKILQFIVRSALIYRQLIGNEILKLKWLTIKVGNVLNVGMINA